MYLEHCYWNECLVVVTVMGTWKYTNYCMKRDERALFLFPSTFDSYISHLRLFCLVYSELEMVSGDDGSSVNLFIIHCLFFLVKLWRY